MLQWVPGVQKQWWHTNSGGATFTNVEALNLQRKIQQTPVNHGDLNLKGSPSSGVKKMKMKLQITVIKKCTKPKIK